MAAGHSQTDVLSRVRREQRTRGKASAFSGLRVVLAATAITVSLMLVAFGAIGILLKSRTAPEPRATRLDNPPAVQQAETPQTMPEPEPAATSTHEKNPEVDELEKKAVKTLRVIAPPPPATEQNENVAQSQPQAAAADPETTAAIPPQTKQEVPPRAVQQRPQQQARRPVPDTQNDNPLFQLFGIKKYR